MDIMLVDLDMRVSEFHNCLHVCENKCLGCKADAIVLPQNIRAVTTSMEWTGGLSNERRGAKGSIERLSGQFEPRNVPVRAWWTHALKPWTSD